MASRMTSLSGQVNDRIRQSEEKTQLGIVALQREIETRHQEKNAIWESMIASVSTKLEQQEFTHREKTGLVERELAGLTTQTTILVNALSGTKAELTAYFQQQQTLQKALGTFQHKVWGRIKSVGYFAAGLSVVVLGLLVGMTRLLIAF